MKIKNLTSKNFDEAVSKGISVVSFCAPWCEPCKQIKFSFKLLKEDFPEVKFFNVNIEEEKKIAIENNILVVPTTIFYLDGKIQDSQVTLIYRDEIEAKIRHIKKNQTNRLSDLK